MPVGVFDSGIGGLTVLDAIVNYDYNTNSTHKKGSDGLPDFEKLFCPEIAIHKKYPFRKK